MRQILLSQVSLMRQSLDRYRFHDLLCGVVDMVGVLVAEDSPPW
jgi:hypothetical protein